jgi:hypothetical protein
VALSASAYLLSVRPAKGAMVGGFQLHREDTPFSFSTTIGTRPGHGSRALPRYGPVVVGIAIGGDVEADVKALLGGQKHRKIRRERDRLAGKAPAHPLPVLDNALAAGNDVDVRRRGKRNVVGRTGEVLVVAMRFPDILDTSLCRGRLGPQEESPHRQDTEQDGEESCEQVSELRSIRHVDLPRFQVVSSAFPWFPRVPWFPPRFAIA